jgi:sugar lactone lactonase YvrE
MAIFGGKLYVADLNQLVIIDVKSAAIEQRVDVPNAQFLNDVAVGYQGVVYVSDTKTKIIHRYQQGVMEEYLTDIDEANGLVAIGGTLVIGSGKKLLLVDNNKQKFTLASGFAESIDGVALNGRGEFLVSCWPGLLYYVHVNGKLDLLLDSRNEKINTADIGFDPESKMLYVPNFFHNSVTAYHLELNEPKVMSATSSVSSSSSSSAAVD